MARSAAAPQTHRTRSTIPARSPRKNAPRSLRRPVHDPLPLNAAAQRLAELFPNGWDWIYAPAASPGKKPGWETIKFPLAPVEMWQHHQNPNYLIGSRPGSQTRWAVIDIDATSPYHPRQDSAALPKLLQSLEELGLCRVLPCQSSESGGLHLYLPLPRPVSSYWLAIALKYHLEASGYPLRAGECEIFPNPKRYVPQGQGYSLFNALRYPMQPGSGFLALDADLNPLSWALEQWLDAFDSCATGQDMSRLQQVMEHSQQNHRLRRTGHPQTLGTWQERIAAEKQGWTGPGQSNEKFKLFACEARVFLGMDSVDQIAAHIATTAQATPGFYEYSQHTRDLTNRSREVAVWAMRYYWPIGAAAQRTTSYHSAQTDIEQCPPPADLNYHRAKQEAARLRIQTAVSQLQAKGELPASITARAQAIAQQAHVSQQTLYKRLNLSLWHPEQVQAAGLQPVLPPTPAKITHLPVNRVSVQPNKSFKPLWLLVISDLLLYVGFVLLEQALVLTLAGHRTRACSKFLEGGSRGVEAAFSPSGWSDVLLTLPESLRSKIAVFREDKKPLSKPLLPRPVSPALPRYSQLDILTFSQAQSAVAGLVVVAGNSEDLSDVLAKVQVSFAYLDWDAQQRSDHLMKFFSVCQLRLLKDEQVYQLDDQLASLCVSRMSALRFSI